MSRFFLLKLVLLQLSAPSFVTSFCPYRIPGTPSRRFRVARDAIPEKGVLFTKDEASGVCVCVVATMHYNPASIARVVNTVDTLAEDKTLASVIIELCPTRYSSWKTQPALWRRALLTSEMQIAAERAKLAGVEFILGDQPIEQLSKRTSEIFMETVKDLASPLDGGWLRCAKDIARAGRSVLPSQPSNVSSKIFSFRSRLDLRQLDLAIIAAAPVSIVRYALAWVVGSPLSIVAVRATNPVGLSTDSFCCMWKCELRLHLASRFSK
jgi:hypothetical protein